MFSLVLAGMMVGIVIAQIPALRNQWLEDRAGAIKSWRLLAYYYFLYLIVGIVVLIAPMRHGGAPEKPVGPLDIIAITLLAASLPVLRFH